MYKRQALVYLNGWLLTRNVNGYAEFTVEAGPYLKYGADNLLKVIADNSLAVSYTHLDVYKRQPLFMRKNSKFPQKSKM